jgi:hypothetical protein
MDTVTVQITGAESWHGKTSGYSTHRCQCDPCKEAFRTFRRESYQRNKEAVAQRNKAWKDTNREKVSATTAAWAAENRDRRAAWQRARRAANPEKYNVLARAARQRDPEHLRQYRSEWRDKNRERLRQQNIEWRAANRERFKATDRLSSQRRRARLQNSLIVPFTNRQLLDRVAYWGDGCYVCRAPWEAIDHVKPISKGGAHCLANLRPICGYHNNRKSDKWRGTAWAQQLVGAGDVT